MPESCHGCYVSFSNLLSSHPHILRKIFVDLDMIMKVISLLFFLSFINAQIALPTFQGVHTSHAAASSLYDFTTHTFTNCGATGRNGPTLANCKSSYDVSWENNTDYFNVPSDAGIQNWTVPTTGTYFIRLMHCNHFYIWMDQT